MALQLLNTPWCAGSPFEALLLSMLLRATLRLPSLSHVVWFCRKLRVCTQTRSLAGLIGILPQRHGKENGCEEEYDSKSHNKVKPILFEKVHPP